MTVPTKVGSLAELAVDMINRASNVVREASPSLTQYTKQTNIRSQMYIENSIASDDISIPIAGTLNQLYASFILTALNLDTMCISGKTVRESLHVLSSEEYQDISVLVKSDFGKEKLDNVVASCEAKLVDLDSEASRLTCGRLLELDMAVVGITASPTDSAEDRKKKFEAAKDNKPETLKVYIYVQILPYIISSEVAKGFLSLNFSPSIHDRWIKVKTGEIEFWKDFIFARDLIDQHAKTLKEDNTGVLAEMSRRQGLKIFSWIKGLLAQTPSHNLANSMYVVEKNTFKEACKAVNIDFNSYVSRQQFFVKTMTIMVVVVDLMYGTVDIYFNGFNMKGTYTFAMVNKIGSKAKSSVDIKEIMTAMSQGMAPKF